VCCGQERHVVLGAPAGIAAAELAAKGGIVRLSLSAKDVPGFALDYRLHKLVW